MNCRHGSQRGPKGYRGAGWPLYLHQYSGEMAIIYEDVAVQPTGIVTKT